MSSGSTLRARIPARRLLVTRGPHLAPLRPPYLALTRELALVCTAAQEPNYVFSSDHFPRRLRRLPDHEAATCAALVVAVTDRRRHQIAPRVGLRCAGSARWPAPPASSSPSAVSGLPVQLNSGEGHRRRGRTHAQSRHDCTPHFSRPPVRQSGHGRENVWLGPPFRKPPITTRSAPLAIRPQDLRAIGSLSGQSAARERAARCRHRC